MDENLVRKAYDILKLGPCSSTTQECPGCHADWMEAATLLASALGEVGSCDCS